MTIEDIKKAVLELPDYQIGALYRWLDEMVHAKGGVWDRQVEADIKEFGVERWLAALEGDNATGGSCSSGFKRLPER